MPPIEQTEAQRKATFAAAGMQPAPTLTGVAPLAAPASALAVPDPRALAAEVNAESAQIFEATKGRDVDLRQSETIIRDLATKLAAPAPVAPPSLSQMFSTERQKLGLEPLEAELAALDSEIERTQVGAFTDADRVDDRAIGNTGRALRQGAISKEAERKTALLNVERSAIARQIDNKMNALQMTMQFTQQDFANASASYNAEFSRSMQMMDLFTGMQDRENAKQDKLADNARANLQTITNLVKESGKSFADMDTNQLRNIRQWEVQAGLPIGTYEAFGSALPQAKVLHTSTGTDAAGKQIVTFIYDDGTGKPGVVEVVGTGGVDAVTRTPVPAPGGLPSPTGSVNEFGVPITSTAPPKAPTEGESSSYVFFERMKNAVTNINSLEAEVAKLGTVGQLQLKYAPDILISPVLQQYPQAQREFTEARLRKDSGAAIPPEEFENDKQTYFPQPGNAGAVLKQKATSRQVALDAVRSASGNKYWQVYGQSPNEANRAATGTANAGDLRAKYNY